MAKIAKFSSTIIFFFSVFYYSFSPATSPPLSPTSLTAIVGGLFVRV